MPAYLKWHGASVQQVMLRDHAVHSNDNLPIQELRNKVASRQVQHAAVLHAPPLKAGPPAGAVRVRRQHKLTCSFVQGVGRGLFLRRQLQRLAPGGAAQLF